MLKREKITSTHTALIYKQYLPIASRKAHLFPGINKALLSIGTFFDHGFQGIFDDTNLLILNIGSGKVMKKVKRDPRSI